MASDHLWHFSEDPTISVFHPRVAPTQQIDGEWVWADDERNAPRYWFPRDCPRATWWPADDPRWPLRVHAIEWAWLDRVRACVLYAYRLPAATFRKTPGGWISAEAVRPLGVEPVGDLLQKHDEAGIELRLVHDLVALWNDVITRPGIEFSGIRLGNAATWRTDP